MTTWITRHEAAKILNISPNHLSNMACRGNGPRNKQVSRFRRWWDLDDVIQYAKSRPAPIDKRKICGNCQTLFSGSGKYCCVDCRQTVTKNRRSMTDKSLKDEYSLKPVKLTAKCPYCGRIHKTVKLGWIGTGTPRLACNQCQHKKYDHSSHLDRQSVPIGLGQ